MRGFAARARIELRDALAYGSVGRVLRQLAAGGALLTSFAEGQRIIHEAALLRLLSNGWLQRRLARRFQRRIASAPASVVRAHQLRGGPGRDGLPVTRTTILKAPGLAGERGVIYSAFEYNWIRALEGIDDLRALLRQYDVVWATSWSPTDYLDLARVLAASAADDVICVQASNFAEVEQLRAFHPRIRVAPNLLCEYLDPASFSSLPPDQRDIDLLVVANWAPFKRHFELFRALRAMPPELRVVCVGQPERGHTRAMTEQLAATYGVRQRIEYRESLSLADVRLLQARSKAAAIFSRREGSCVAAVEALFAGASLGLMAGAQVGATAYVNPTTGVSLRAAAVATDLMQLIEGAAGRSPREWAVAHLGRDRATRALNEWLKGCAAERGLPWTADIASMSWSPYPWVSEPAAREALLPAAVELNRSFPKVFRTDLLDASRF